MKKLSNLKNFIFYENKLTSLYSSPKNIEIIFHYYSNKLFFLDYNENEVIDLYCYKNTMSSLSGMTTK